MPQVTKPGLDRPPSRSSQQCVDEIREAFWIVGRSVGQVRVHERLLRAAGIPDRPGRRRLLYMLQAHGESVRVTGLADLLGVDHDHSHEEDQAIGARGPRSASCRSRGPSRHPQIR